MNGPFIFIMKSQLLEIPVSSAFLQNSWMGQLIYWETKVFMTNEAKHERPTLSSFSFGSAVFTNSGMSDIAPGVNDHLVVRTF